MFHSFISSIARRLSALFTNLLLRDEYKTRNRLKVTSREWGHALRYLAKVHAVTLNHTQVQKLLYIAYSLNLYEYGTVICEKPEAWPFGPVFRKLHNDRYEKDINCGIYRELKAKYPQQMQVLTGVLEKLSNIAPEKLVAWVTSKDKAWGRHVLLHHRPFGSKMLNSEIYWDTEKQTP